MNKKIGIVAAVLLMCVTAFASRDAASQVSDLITPTLIDRAGWTLDWQVSLPVRANEKVDRLFLFETNLYVLSDSNMLFCLDAATGQMRFVTRLSSQRLPVCNPAYFEKKLWFLVGNQMVVVDPWAGSIVEQHNFTQIGNTFECGLAMNAGYIYITGSDSRLHAFSRDGYWRAFTATADNDSPIVTLSATDGSVLFATQAGNVVAMADNQPVKLWQFDTTGTIASELTVSEDKVYIGSQDAKLYKLDAKTGRLAWPSPFYAGARIHEPVVVGRKLVYLPAGPMGVYGLNKDTGKAIWQVKDGIGVLTETETHSFVFSKPGLLNVMDNQTGRNLYSVNFSRVERFASSMDKPELYVADEKGRIAAVTVR